MIGGVHLASAGPSRSWWVESLFRCDKCHRLNIGSVLHGSGPSRTDTANLMAFWAKNPPTNWSPAFIKGQDYPDVPESVATPATEAHRCRSIDALMSSILMARSVIEAVAKDNGIDDGSLYYKIDQLHTKGLVDEFAKETAHTIRVFGNDMAHGDFSEPVDTVDADSILDFMDLILQSVYQSRAKLRRLREAAAARAAARESNS